jgi:hypothetical protein
MEWEARGMIIPQEGSLCDLSNNVYLLMEWKQDSKSSQDFGDRRTIIRELQRASEKRTFVRIEDYTASSWML